MVYMGETGLGIKFLPLEHSNCMSAIENLDKIGIAMLKIENFH